jgi:hypothetical protein
MTTAKVMNRISKLRELKLRLYCLQRLTESHPTSNQHRMGPGVPHHRVFSADVCWSLLV